jgi:hypothetical protein
MNPFPIVMSSAGYVPQTPMTLQQLLINTVAAINPGYTANLPGSLIEDISSTDTYALLQCDSSIAEIIGSVTPYGANNYLLWELGVLFGVPPQTPTNTSVYVQFTGPPGFVIGQGFTVSDGNYQYEAADGGIIGTGGVSDDIYMVATVPGMWAVPAGSVTQLITSVPTGINITVINNADGDPATTAETAEQYRTRVMQAQYAPSQSMLTYLKTMLQRIPGVSARLVSVRQYSQLPSLWEVICGGGDQYAVAYAIYMAGLMLTNITGSVMIISAITQANPGVVTTELNHGLLSGQIVSFSGCEGMTSINEVPFNVTVIDAHNFSIGTDTSGLSAYTGGGYVNENPRNITVPVFDYPDTYAITFVNPPQQLVAIVVTWNTIATNFISPVVIAQLINPAVVDYINSIIVGQPINIYVLDTVIQEAVAGLIPAELLTRIIISVSINGIGVSPISGTGEIPGDPESYFFTSTSEVTVLQG